MNVGGGSKRTLGNMNRAVAVNDASIEAVNATQARVTHDRKERRGVFAFDEAGVAAVFTAGGLVGSVAGFGGAGSVELSLLIGISH